MMNVARGIAASCLVFAISVPVANAQDLGPRLKKIKDTATITIGYRESSVPLSYLDDNQKPIGFSMDLCNLVVEKIKTGLSLPEIKVNYQPVNSSNRIPLVANGTVDIECGSTANTIARQNEVAFSVTTFQPQFKWLALRDSGVKTTDDLKGKTVAVTQGTNTSQFVARLNTEKQLGMNILQGKDHAESFLLVQTGRATAFMEDDILLAGLRANAKDPSTLVLLDDPYASDPYALMFGKGDPSYKKLVDEALISAMKSGEFARLYAKWFESKIPPKNINLEFPMSDKLKGLIENPSDKAIGQ